MKLITNLTLALLSIFVTVLSAQAVETSSFCEAHVPGTFVIKADEGNWNWGMAPIYDEDGKLHVFNSIIPNDGSWIKNSKIGHYTADKPEGPYKFVDITFASKEASYHNPQISKVDDTYVLVFLLNRYNDENGSKQEVGIATSKSLDGSWTESSFNPVIPASGILHGDNINHASNPTFVATPDGKYRIYYKSITDKYSRKNSIREISFASSDTIEGPYVNYEKNPVISYADKQIDIEDPYAFFYNGKYYLIVEDRRGVADMIDAKSGEMEQLKPGGLRPGLIYQSKDGIDWGKPKIGYQTNEIYFGKKLARSERPSILWKNGKPECLFLACHDDDPTAGFFVRIRDWEGE